MDARTRVAGALEALKHAVASGLSTELGPERWQPLQEDLEAWLTRLDACRSDADWERLRVELEALGTRHGIRRILDEPLVRDAEVRPPGPDRILRGDGDRRPPAEDAERSARDLGTRIRELLGGKKPAPLVTYPEAIVDPGEVELNTTFELKVTARAHPGARTGRKMELTRAKPGPVDVEVRVELPPGEVIEARGPLSNPLRVPEGQDAATLTFPLLARALGLHALKVAFWHQGIERAVLPLEVPVIEPRPDAARRTSPAVPVTGELQPAAAPYRGLRLHLGLLVKDADRHVYRAQLVFEADRERTPIDGHVDLPATVAGRLIALCRDLRLKELMREWPDAGDRERHLRSVGAQLAGDLLPGPIADALHAAPKGTALHIEAEDPWVPWEAAWLGPLGDGGAFLGEKLAVTRWLRERTPWDELPGGRAVLVTPTKAGLHTDDERRALRDLTGRPPEELAAFGEVHDRLAGAPDPRTGNARPRCGFLHFVCHGRAEPDKPLDGQLALDGGHLHPTHVTERDRTNGAPLAGACVLINACEAGIPGFALTGHGGFAAAFLRAGAGAVIAPSWVVSTQGAARFAVRFYRGLSNGETVGAAGRAARLAARAQGDPSGLGYAVYASPLARLVTGAAAPSPGGRR